MGEHGSSGSLPTPQPLLCLFPGRPFRRQTWGRPRILPRSWHRNRPVPGRTTPKASFSRHLHPTASSLGAEGKSRRPLPGWRAKGTGGVDVCTHAHTLTGLPRALHSSAAAVEASSWAFALRDPEGFRQITSAFEEQRRNSQRRHQTRNAHHDGPCNTTSVGKRGNSTGHAPFPPDPQQPFPEGPQRRQSWGWQEAQGHVTPAKQARPVAPVSNRHEN